MGKKVAKDKREQQQQQQRQQQRDCCGWDAGCSKYSSQTDSNSRTDDIGCGSKNSSKTLGAVIPNLHFVAGPELPLVRSASKF